MKANPWLGHLKADEVAAVLLPDGVWHQIVAGSFERKAGEGFAFTERDPKDGGVVLGKVQGPVASVLAVRSTSRTARVRAKEPAPPATKGSVPTAPGAPRARGASRASIRRKEVKRGTRWAVEELVAAKRAGMTEEEWYEHGAPPQELPT